MPSVRAQVSQEMGLIGIDRGGKYVTDIRGNGKAYLFISSSEDFNQQAYAKQELSALGMVNVWGNKNVWANVYRYIQT